MIKPISQVGPIRLPLKIANKEHIFILNYYSFKNGRWLSAQYENTPIDDYVPFRIESACVFGHVLHSVKCDCGFQLDKALSIFSELRKGCLIYAIDQDARGLGIEAHFKIYNMQQNMNMDTPEVFKTLNAKWDNRDYSPVEYILNHLNIKKVKLLSNNESRKQFLLGIGIELKEERIEMSLNNYNMATLMLEKEDLGYHWSFKTHKDWLLPIQNKVIDNEDIRYCRIVENNVKVYYEQYTNENDLGKKILSEINIEEAKEKQLIVYLTDLPRYDELELYSKIGVYFIVVPFSTIPSLLQQRAKELNLLIQDWERTNKYTKIRKQWHLISVQSEIAIYQKDTSLLVYNINPFDTSILLKNLAEDDYKIKSKNCIEFNSLTLKDCEQIIVKYESAFKN